jgi:hypothetical protein
MSNKRYIEIYSQRRNRTIFPFVSQFVIPLEQSGLSNTSSTAKDPVVDGFPSYLFKLNTASSTPATTPIGPADGPLNFTNGTRTNPVLANTSSFDDNFYNGYHMIYTPTGCTGCSQTRTVFNYTGSTESVNLDFPYGTNWSSTGAYNIVDPSVPFNYILSGGTNSISGIALSPILDFSSYTDIIPALPNNFDPAVNASFPAGYFKGFYLQILDATVLPTVIVLEERIVADFIPLDGTTTYQLLLDNAFSLNWDDVTTNNPGDYYFRLTNNSIPFIHLQPVDVFNFSNPADFNQFYTGNIIFNETINVGRKVTAYSADTRIAILESGFNDSNTLSTFNPTTATIPDGNDNYSSTIFSIRNDTPIVVSQFVVPPSSGSYNPPIPATSPPWPTTAFPPSTIGNNVVYFDPSIAPYDDNIWNGKYVYIRPQSYSFTDAPSSKNLYKINKYWGGNPGPKVPPPSTNPATFPGAPYSAVLDKTLEIDATAGKTFEILNFSYDNFAPLCYMGSTVSQNELVCYEIELVSIVLPNVVLKAGSRISFYPFIYVQFGTYNSSMNHSNCSIYSNNPDSNKALFICPTTDVSNPLTTQFIKLNSQGVQTVKFKPNDNMIFSVFLPNGELFLPILSDNFSPQAPNPLLQIEAVFSIKRLS